MEYYSYITVMLQLCYKSTKKPEKLYFYKKIASICLVIDTIDQKTLYVLKKLNTAKDY